MIEYYSTSNLYDTQFQKKKILTQKEFNKYK